MPKGDLLRVWSESRTLALPDGSGEDFRARIVAHLGWTDEGDTVFRVEKSLVHHVIHGSRDLANCEGCTKCAGHTTHEVIVDPVSRTRNDAIRLAIHHADELLARLRAAVDELTPPVAAEEASRA